MFQHLSLRLRIFLFFAFLAAATSALAGTGLVLGYLRLGEAQALSAFVVAGLVAILAILALTTWIWVLFDENVARPVERLAAEMRARAHAGVAHPVDGAGARHLGDLGPAAAAVTRSLAETRDALATAVARETARLATEQARLEALLGEMPDGIAFCTPAHRLVLYNERVRDILGATEALGLNRPLSGLLRMGPVRMAYDRLVAGDGARGGTDILVSTRGDARLLEARMRLLRLEGQDDARPGYVLTLRDVSGTLPVLAERAHLLEELLAGARAAGLTGLASRIAARKAATDTLWWPMEDLAASDLGAALGARLARSGIRLDSDLGTQTLRCDGFAVTRLLERLALDWTAAGAGAGAEADGLFLTLAPEAPPGMVALSLEARAPLPAGWRDWLTAPLSQGLSGFSGQDVLVCHGAALTPAAAVAAARSALRLALPLATPRAARRGAAPTSSPLSPPASPSASRRATAPSDLRYDFGVLAGTLPAPLAETGLGLLDYVVLDTETTGLDPDRDEICQIAAVRIVRGRIRPDERLDLLVDPGRPIPAGATAIHRITDAMVNGAPDVSEAVARLHAFARGSVLVAHNAPFDMAFLRRREAATGARFDQPILDTVLCSAILYGQSAEHTLDALCDRLGIVIPDGMRHTALGDAMATAEAMVRMIPMLTAVDIGTLGALIRGFDLHRRLIGHLN